MGNLDEKDCIILNILQNNCRASLTYIAKQVGLSIDSVKKRIKKMENDIFYPRIQIRPRSLGYMNIVDIKIKLNNHSKKETDRFVQYLLSNPKIAEIFSVSGEWDFSIVVVSKDVADLTEITSDIKNKFGSIISSWSESATLRAYKFETYDMIKLLGFDK
ncbi:Lrp/AsnC family transcriptional regulator [Candidatus Woesearchaeota archaeon]|nr:Lrp/AsnC family transcriptional regulator [Candidatus Woesearchaeota archaeon]